MHLHAVNNVFI